MAMVACAITSFAYADDVNRVAKQCNEALGDLGIEACTALLLHVPSQREVPRLGRSLVANLPAFEARTIIFEIGGVVDHVRFTLQCLCLSPGSGLRSRMGRARLRDSSAVFGLGRRTAEVFARISCDPFCKDSSQVLANIGSQPLHCGDHRTDYLVRCRLADASRPSACGYLRADPSGYDRLDLRTYEHQARLLWWP